VSPLLWLHCADKSGHAPCDAESARQFGVSQFPAAAGASAILDGRPMPLHHEFRRTPLARGDRLHATVAQPEAMGDFALTEFPARQQA